jgi:hypothetical protein
MKTFLIIPGLLLVCSFTQARPTYPAVTAVKSTPAPAPVNSINYVIGHQDADSQVWQKIVCSTDKQGKAIYQTNQAYVELATGLNYWRNGRWNTSQEKIEISPDGKSAYAINGQHQVYFPGDIYDGVIKLVTPDGKTLQSQPVGLGYSDGSNNVLLAVVTNSTGAILPSGNEVLYANAFAGLKADLRYRYTKAGMEQDVVLLEQLPDPASLGLNPAKARLQMFTEFTSSPRPTIKATSVKTAAGVLEDDDLNFGGMQMGRGKAFLLGSKSPAVQVNKRWVAMEGRQILTEEVPMVSMAPALESLPSFIAKSSATKPVLSKSTVLPPTRLVRATPNAMFLAKAEEPDRGLVLDYYTVNGAFWTTPFTFAGGTTYYVTGSFGVNNTLTIEGGTVIKYVEGNYGPNGGITGFATFKCQTSEYRPAIITSKNDNSVGETISGSTGHPKYYNTAALHFDVASLTGPIQYLHIRYAGIGLYFSDTVPAVVRHCQFLQVGDGIENIDSGTVTVENDLFSQVTNYVFGADNYPWPTVFAAAHVTVDNAINLTSSGVTLSMTNSILSHVTNLVSTPTGDYNVFYPSTFPKFGTHQIPASSSPFTSRVNGNYYVTDATDYRVGSGASLSAALQDDFQNMTTFPPDTSKSGTTITASTEWDQNPNVVPRETSPPYMLGYHYPALDYMISGVNVQGVTLTLGQGVAVGVYGGLGLETFYAAALVSQGTVLVHNQLCWYPTVQEQPGTLPTGNLIEWDGYDPPASINAQFTDFDGISGTGSLIWGIDCQLQLWGCDIGPGSIAASQPPGTDGITNNIFEYVNLYIDSFDWQGPVYFYNNTFIDTTVTVNDMFAFSGYRKVKDNLFDGCTVNVADPVYADYGHNAYSGGSTTLTPNNTDILLTTMNFATGPLGYRYIDTSTTPTLVNAGSQSVYDAGFYNYNYFFTIVTNQTPDGYAGNGNGDPVDIGFHYAVLEQPWAFNVSANVCHLQSVPVTLEGGSHNTPFVTYTILSQPQHGTLSGTAPYLTYTETTPNFVGQDTFTYQTFDGYLASVVGTVTITVGDLNPQAYNMGGITHVGQAITLVLEGSDMCNDPLTFSISPGTGPTHGQLGTTITQIDATHASVVYTPYLGFTGQDSFQFSVNDVVGTATASAQISVISSPIVLVTLNNGGGGPIETFNFGDGSDLNSFVPASENNYNFGPNDPYANGRGVAINTTATGTEIFYTQVGTAYGGPPFIHVCSYGTDGSGSVTDSRTPLTSPDQRIDSTPTSAGIAALAIHYDPVKGKNELYALTGYGLAYPYRSFVYELDPANGNVIAGPVTIPTPIDPQNGLYSTSDGFTVLPNGDFLINDYDGADGAKVYREYYGFNAPVNLQGTLVPSGLHIDVSSFSSHVGFNIGGGVGVTCAPDGSLYFMVFESYFELEDIFTDTAVVHTDSNGNYISSGPGVSLHVEGIAVLPQ